MRCVEYSGYIAPNGYGLDYDPETKKTISAHRRVFKLTYGYLPEVVMHICDNKRCINPEHLKGGTQSDNIKDCVSKNRHGARPKLTPMQVDYILNSSESSRQLAILFGVNQKTICNVRNNKYNYKLTGHGGSCGS